MKVIGSLSQVYDESLPLFEKLRANVDRIIASKKEPQWHYQSRIKTKESFALKMETGRVSDSKAMNDLFACTIVVENAARVEAAIQLIKNEFDLKDRKPQRIDFTHKRSDSFQFDDLRLYVSLKEMKGLPPDNFSSLIFEIQVKTFLQHAWTIATHDMIYKADDISWAKQRIAFQIKAMLEHAELSISSVDALSKHSSISKQTKEIDELLKIKRMVEELWSKDDLPQGIVRLLENIRSLCLALNLSLDQLKQILIEETSVGRGTGLKDLSPFLIILKSVYKKHPDSLHNYQINPKKRFLLFLPPELDIAIPESPVAIVAPREELAQE